MLASSHEVVVEVVVDVVVLVPAGVCLGGSRRLLGEVDSLIVHEAGIAWFQLVLIELLIHLLLVHGDLLLGELVEVGVLVVEVGEVLLLGGAPVVPPAVVLFLLLFLLLIVVILIVDLYRTVPPHLLGVLSSFWSLLRVFVTSHEWHVAMDVSGWLLATLVLVVRQVQELVRVEVFIILLFLLILLPVVVLVLLIVLVGLGQVLLDLREQLLLLLLVLL